jgi:REP element-mobilizing transposase RayT
MAQKPPTLAQHFHSAQLSHEACRYKGVEPFLNRPRPHSFTSLFVHLIWSTRNRYPWIEPRLDAWLAAFLERKARVIECAVLAAGNAPDHVHVLLRHPPRVSVAQIAHRLKGASSRALTLQEGQARDWQVGYWAESVGRRELEPLTRYIVRQRAHHEANTALESWEPPPVHRASPLASDP